MLTPPVAPPSRAVYLIVLADCLVAQDLAETVAVHDRDAEVILRQSLSDAIVALAAVAELALAFVGAGPAEFEASPLAGMIRARGGRVVLIGDDAESAGAAAGYAVLARPFSLSQILAELSRPAPR